MESTRMLTSTQPVGMQSGTEFVDKSLIQNIDDAAISRIMIGHAQYVNSLTVHYGTKPAVRRGSPTGPQTEIALAPGEFITIIRGNYLGGPISDLYLESNKGAMWGPYGTHAQDSQKSTFLWRAADMVPADLAPYMGLLYFSGRADSSYIWVLEATFAKYTFHDQRPPAVKYEEQIYDECDTQPPVLLSKFARNLMSPTVTLVVGADHIEFHTCENIVCSLPFFRAAFKGEFKEASEKKITMPEDEPESVSALIEFLYDGRYTYTYNPKKTTLFDSTATIRTPVSDLAEGSFHVSVYAIANKYDCQPLVKAAVKSFTYVLKHLKGADVVRLWKTAYNNGLLLSDWENDEGLISFKQGLAKLLKGLYVSDREEMDNTIAECPALATDFLRIAVSS